MKELTYKSKYNEEPLRVYVVKDNYTSNDNTALLLYAFDNEFGEYEPYTDITVNIDTMPAPDIVTLDTNNFPDVVEWLTSLGAIKSTLGMAHSGWCDYPIVELDLSILL